MILVAGLTPAWQQIAVLDQLRTGEVNRAREVHWCASGKVLNVGLALTQLGAATKTLSLVGSGSSGDAIRHEFALMGVDVEWIETSTPQRVCTTLLGRETRQTTEIVENSSPVSAGDLQKFAKVFVEKADVTWCDLLVLTGSLPRGTPTDFFATLLAKTQNHAILDIRGPELLAALPHRPLLVKPNREELAHTLNRSLDSDGEVWKAIRELHERGAKWAVITDGANPVFVSRDDGRERGRWRISPPKVNVINPIGCGDCLTAGIAYSLEYREGGVLEAIQFGVAAAAYNATQLLPARMDLREVTSLVGQVETESAAG